MNDANTTPQVNQAAEAKRMAKVAEQRRKMQEKAKYEAELREAAFDNEVDDMVELLGMDLVEVDAKDPNGDTPFLEAAGGGSVDALNLLAERGATVNARGKFMRTPLFRAAFGGHHKAVIRLLELGCDPRLHDAEGVLPADVSANAKCKDHINKWDLDETDRIALLFDEKRAAAEAIRAAQLQKESEVVASDLEMAEKDYKARQRELAKAYQEFEKRLTEYDTVMHTPEEKKPQVVVDAVLVAVKEGEKHLANMKIAADEATMKYQAAKLKVREHEHKEMEEAGTLPQHERCSLRELDDVVLKDVGEKLSNDDRWPLLIDLSKQAATFFRYRDVNYVYVKLNSTFLRQRLSLKNRNNTHTQYVCIWGLNNFKVFAEQSLQSSALPPLPVGILLCTILLTCAVHTTCSFSSKGLQPARKTLRPMRYGLRCLGPYATANHLWWTCWTLTCGKRLETGLKALQRACSSRW